jgi:hypothetical protein
MRLEMGEEDAEPGADENDGFRWPVTPPAPHWQQLTLASRPTTPSGQCLCPGKFRLPRLVDNCPPPPGESVLWVSSDRASSLAGKSDGRSRYS